MKRLSRHTVVVLFVLLLSSIGGLSLAVVAFGQDGADPDATVPLGDYTATTPSTSTAPLSSYTTTTSTTPLSSYTNTTTTKTTTPTQTTESTTTTGTKPSRTTGTSAPSGGGGGDFPSQATRSGPTHLAFTGGEPIVIGAFGVALMGAGLVLHRRRRRSA
jgi:LPXTG-motif cell wall-anchored protein